ncbi:hypothetical protein [Zoogloea sp.]|uniref:hypothetical protein n=1 Tax=Zoogloea sp. TaxID=49181 RepID=UPI001AD3A50A|nr:hypothetical protein [Zoogloea sp.]MBN8284998.1 hypothetical protein [Zoogloea sp.]
MIEALESYSRQMAEDLFSVFPDWEHFLTVVAEDGLNFFRVEVPPSPGGKNGPLGITSLYNEEITVYFGSCHRHYASILPSAEESAGAISFIQQLLSEERVVVSYLCSGDNVIKDGVFSGSAVLVSEIPDANYEYYYANALRVRSWKGTYDNDFPAPYVSSKPIH